ncbi:MAG TPA: hypothetical protein VNO70_27200 [Blastocatellia bacterium]|nr:hypothetical protein [Blastocatellia bacterium]
MPQKSFFEKYCVRRIERVAYLTTQPPAYSTARGLSVGQRKRWHPR